MVNSLLISTGIILMVFSSILCLKIIKINTIKEFKKSWYLMLGLIIFFLIGYVVFYFLSTNYAHISINSLLICLILFFGAIFVISILFISYQLISILTKKGNELDQTNKTLVENATILKNKQDELVKTEEQLKQKNTELEEALESFYTLRIGMQKDMASGKLEEENRKIKEKLDSLKEKKE